MATVHVSCVLVHADEAEVKRRRWPGDQTEPSLCFVMMNVGRGITVTSGNDTLRLQW